MAITIDAHTDWLVLIKINAFIDMTCINFIRIYFRIQFSPLFQLFVINHCHSDVFCFDYFSSFSWLVSQGSWVRYPVWQHTCVSPSAFSRRAVVSYWQKYMHEVLVNRLGGLSLPRKSVVRLNDHPDMTLDVYRGRKTTMQQLVPFPSLAVVKYSRPSVAWTLMARLPWLLEKSHSCRFRII